MSFFELQIKVEIFKLYSWIWLFHGRVDAAVSKFLVSIQHSLSDTVGNTKGGSITALLTSCLTHLELAV
jgi:hypothetical protein